MDPTPQQFALIAKNWRDLIRPRALDIETHTRTHARVRCEPLERGFGTTLGMALRRTLLSALPGAAITHVTIDGECDVTDLVLALKELVFASELDDSVTVHLAGRGRTVTGRDIALVAGVTCCNPDHRICTLADDSGLALELTIGMGRGYVPADRHANVPGAIAIDALFSPIRRADFAVTNARVGQQTDYDRLTLDIETNGAIDPVDAVHRAAAILQHHAAVFLNFEEVPEPAAPVRDAVAEALDENLWRTIDELELSVRAENCLRSLEITYIGELVQKTESELMKTRGFGRKSLTEIAAVLGEMALQLGMKLDNWPGTKPLVK
jgi:DNA-directed RNA polymerase subunit alpha